MCPHVCHASVCNSAHPICAPDSICDSAHPICAPSNAHASIHDSAHPICTPGNVSASIRACFSGSLSVHTCIHASILHNVIYYNMHVCGRISLVVVVVVAS